VEKCEGCGKDVHESARTCPHCGKAKFKQASVGMVVFMFIAWFFIVQLGLGFIIGVFAVLSGGQQAVRQLQDPINSQILRVIGVLCGLAFSTVLTIYGKLPGAMRRKTPISDIDVIKEKSMEVPKDPEDTK
jgi:hypothetical protein